MRLCFRERRHPVGLEQKNNKKQKQKQHTTRDFPVDKVRLSPGKGI